MNRLTKLTRTILAGVTAVVLALGIAWAQTTLQRPLNPQTGFSAGVTYVSGAVATSGVGGELIVCRDCAPDSGPALYIWDHVNSQLDALSLGNITGNLVFEGVTDDASQVTLSVVDPTVDATFRFLSKLTAATIDLLDAGLPPLVGPTVELPDREYSGSVNVAPRFKAWFRTAPVYTFGVPVTAGDATACSTTGNPNFILGPAIIGYGFELDAKGTQTVCGNDYAAADGLGLHNDATTNEGWELTQGIVDGSPGAFTVGTSPAFYMSTRFAIATVANTDQCLAGFRVVEAYQDATLVTYTDYFAVGVGDLADAGAGDFQVFESLNGTSAETDIAESDWTDNQVHTVSVLVSAAGVATGYVEGTVITDSGVAMTFDDTDIVVPFFWCIGDVTGADVDVDIVFWEVGLQ